MGAPNISNSSTVAPSQSAQPGTNTPLLVPPGTAYPGNFATFATDASGNPNGINTPNSVSLSLPWTSQGLVNTVLIGDSITAASNQGMQQVTAASRTNNIVTLTVASTGGWNTGQRGNVVNMLDSSYCANDVAITVVNGTTFTYPSVGVNGSTSNLNANAVMGIFSSEDLSDYGAFTWLNAKSGGAFNLLHNGGANGQTSADMLNRFSRDCLSYAGTAKLLILQTGYNDFAVYSLTAQQVFANVSAMAAQALGAGMKVCIIGALPWSSGVNTSFLPQALNYNRLIKWYCASTPNCRYIDAPAYFVNSTSTSYAPITGMLNSDGIHPFSRGGERLGQALWDVLQYETAVPKRLVSTLADTLANNASGSNIYPDAPWTNTGGALAGTSPATGTAAGGWAVTNNGSGTSVASCPAGFDGIGYSQQVVFTPSANNDACVISSQGYKGTVSAGQTIVLSAKFSFSGLSGANIKTIGFALAFSSGNPKFVFNSASSGGTSTYYNPNDQTITFVSNPITVPSGATGVNPNLTVTAAGAGTALTIQLGRVSVEVVTLAQL